MPTLKNYDPDQVNIVLGSILIQGYAEDSFVTVARSNPSFTKKVGTQGDVTRSRSRDKTGTVTIRLMAESPSNALLAALVALGESDAGALGADIKPISVENLNGGTLYSGAQAWVTAPAEGDYAKESGEREWIIDVAFLEMSEAGAVF